MKTHQPAPTSKTRDSGVRIPRQTIKTLGYTALLTLSLTLGMHYAQAASLQNNPIYAFKKAKAMGPLDAAYMVACSCSSAVAWNTGGHAPQHSRLENPEFRRVMRHSA